MQEPTDSSTVAIVVDVAHPQGLPEPVVPWVAKEPIDPSLEKHSPWKWAVLKGDLKPEDRLHVPWRFHQAVHFCKWPATDIAPDFVISESEYDDGMAHVSIY